jgi:hypothetical protein
MRIEHKILVGKTEGKDHLEERFVAFPATKYV